MRIFKGKLHWVIAKLILVTAAMTLLGYLMMAAFSTGDTNIAIFLGICILILAFAYLTNWVIPLKFFAPGLMFLAAFVIVPLVFTLSMSGFKYQTGNMLEKQAAIDLIQEQGTEPDSEGTAFDNVVVGYQGTDKTNTAILVSIPIEETVTSNKPSTKYYAYLGYYGGDKTNVAILATDYDGQSAGRHPYFIATKDELINLTESQIGFDEWMGYAITAPGFKIFTKQEFNDYSDQLDNTTFKYDGQSFIAVDAKTPKRSFVEVSVREVSTNLSFKYFLSSKTELTNLDKTKVQVDLQGHAFSTAGFTKYTDSEIGQYSNAIGNDRLKYKDPYFIRIDDISKGFATVNIQNLTYDKKTDTVTSALTGAVYKDDGRGNFRNPDNKEDYLDPGWKQGIWFENFTNLFTDPKVREPLVQVFIWTITFAILTVLTQFALGLLVAIAMDKKIRGRGVYRSLMILPYAMPSIMSILIWGGMLDDNGAINQIFHADITWLHDPVMAKVSVLLVNLWLGFPYFYLISSGSLQAIPKELAESASIDGAHPRQIFRLITLPLLLRMLTPLLIASFAFNFNNFNIIYLLTGGGPSFEFGSIAGATDILISYTYKIAFGSVVQDYGLASAISVVIFVIVASISMYGIRKSKVLDDFA